MKNFCKNILDQASQVVSNSKTLDYKRIAIHDDEEVEKLHGVLRELDIKAVERSTASRSTTIHQQPGEMTVTRNRVDTTGMSERDAKVTRRGEIMEMLNDQGFGDRVGRVYDTFSPERSRSVGDVPNRNGLPLFEIAVAPDFAPISGLHGIFISNLEVVTAILPFPGEEHEWQVLNRKNYQSLEQMAEFVTLLSAGFELP